MAEKSFAVLGDPISHSLSPKIHLAAYRYLGVDFSYEAIQVPANSLEQFIATRGESFNGFSVTMPLKFEAAELSLNQEHLWGTGVANTLVKSGDHWDSYNTDVAGISFALSESFASNPASTAILGSGATARSALVALAKGNLENVTVYARDLSRAVELVDIAKKCGLKIGVENLSKYSNDHGLTINTLPAGVVEKLNLERRQPGWLLSANYSQKDQSFINLFQPEFVVSGVEMLLGQAIEQIKLFVAKELPLSATYTSQMLEAMRAAL